MFKSRRNFLVSLCTILTVALSLIAVSQEAMAKGKPIQIQGILVRAVPRTSTVVIRRTGTTVTVVLPAGIKIERNGVKVGLNAFKAGDRVQVRYAPNGVTIVKFEGTGV